ncbi:MAG: hypothetical protein WDW36_002878 [Sanguina aurantia]
MPIAAFVTPYVFRTGKEYACKSIKKRLVMEHHSPAKQQQHLVNIQREVDILRRLRGTLNVVTLEEAFEDADFVYIIMELCRGGELLHRIGAKHYSERTVASFMRAVLRTLAQCHHHNILHRDIKPGNFMLMADTEKSPLKAIDFGLAVFFDPKKLPRTDLGLEGTPWYQSPEMLSNAVEPASDVWAAGVMAFQLLSGRFPFDDAKNPRNPALSLIWRSILTEEPDLNKPAWAGISTEAKGFIRSLLDKDPRKRPTAVEGLSHPWLQGSIEQREEGAPLAATVVQRLQAYSIQSALKRTVLDMIANELLQQHIAASAGGALIKVEEEGEGEGEEGEEAGQQDLEFQQAAAETISRRFSCDFDSDSRGDGRSGAARRLNHSCSSSRLRQLAASDMLHGLARKHHTVHAGNDAQLQLWHARDSHTPTPNSPAQNTLRRLCASNSEVLGILGGAGAGAAVTESGELAVVLGGSLHSEDAGAPPVSVRHNPRGSSDRSLGYSGGDAHGGHVGLHGPPGAPLQAAYRSQSSGPGGCAQGEGIPSPRPVTGHAPPPEDWTGLQQAGRSQSGLKEGPGLWFTPDRSSSSMTGRGGAGWLSPAAHPGMKRGASANCLSSLYLSRSHAGGKSSSIQGGEEGGGGGGGGGGRTPWFRCWS